ncbi:MAG: hypothetical protein ACREE5_12525 [Acetobacteraceae bacterium]
MSAVLQRTNILGPKLDGWMADLRDARRNNDAGSPLGIPVQGWLWAVTNMVATGLAEQARRRIAESCMRWRKAREVSP